MQSRSRPCIVTKQNSNDCFLTVYNGGDEEIHNGKFASHLFHCVIMAGGLLWITTTKTMTLALFRGKIWII